MSSISFRLSSSNKQKKKIVSNRTGGHIYYNKFMFGYIVTKWKKKSFKFLYSLKWSFNKFYFAFWISIALKEHFKNFLVFFLYRLMIARRLHTLNTHTFICYVYVIPPCLSSLLLLFFFIFFCALLHEKLMNLAHIPINLFRLSSLRSTFTTKCLLFCCRTRFSKH